MKAVLSLLMPLIIISGISDGRVCVLEQMLIFKHSTCTPPINCTNWKFWKWEDDDSDYNDEEAEVLLPPLEPGSPAFSHYQSSVKSDDESSPPENNLIHAAIDSDTILKTCESVSCDADCMYRRYDGRNNNLKYPSWATAESPMLRFLPPNYSGPNGKVAQSRNGTALPNSRYISTKIFPYANLPSTEFTLAQMQWGQLVAHDVGLSPNKGLNCCADVNGELDDCLAIKIPSNDPFFSKWNQTCLNMMRTRSVKRKFGCSKYPDQISDVTHYIDLSMLYGSNLSNAQSLRQCKGGLLQVYKTKDGRNFPPLSFNSRYDCASENLDEVCFRAGDSRINQNTQLTCLMVVLIREHNRLALSLSNLNPHWNDERLFQEARAILIAQFQHITYKHWLLHVIGESFASKYNLLTLDFGYSYSYNENISAATINSFMTGAFRVFHSSIQGQLWMMNPNTQCPYANLNISDYMLQPSIVLDDNNLDELLLGLTVEPVKTVNRFFTDQITNMMFHGANHYGEDLESFDIQRGRDHGIPSYNSMRELCHRSRVNNFEDLVHDMSKEHIELLKNVYTHPDDIDYFVGGILENRFSNSTVGKTFFYIFIEQFIRKKIGDRFWYENGGQRHSFTIDQLQEIRKCTLSRLLCDNGDNITVIQPDSFRFSSLEGNSLVNCSQISALNLSKWIETTTMT